MSSTFLAPRLLVGRRGQNLNALYVRCASFAAALPRRAVRALQTWNRRLNDRAFLTRLQGFELSEMGMTPMTRDHEAKKPFWQK